MQYESPTIEMLGDTEMAQVAGEGFIFVLLIIVVSVVAVAFAIAATDDPVWSPRWWLRRRLPGLNQPRRAF